MRIVPHHKQLSIFAGKVCRACGFWKPLTDYYRDKRKPDGHLPTCKYCQTLRYSTHSTTETETLRRKDLEQSRQLTFNRNSMQHEGAKRRKYLIANAGSFTREEWRDLCVKYKHRCLRCGKRTKLTVDHVVPVSKGGSNRIENIQPLCLPCNLAKHTETIDYRP